VVEQEFEVPDFEEVVAYLSGNDTDGADSATPQEGGSSSSSSSSSSSGGAQGGTTTANPFHTGSDLAVEESAETTPLV
jgi:hypothetical protein